MNQEEMFDKIDAYLWDLLPADERLAFENDAKNDAGLAAETVLRRLENDALRLSVQDDLRAKIQDWKADFPAEKLEETDATTAKIVPLSKTRVVRMRPMQWAAAATVLLLFSAWSVRWAKSNYGNDALVTEFNAKSGSILRGLNDGSATELDEATRLMNEKKFADALPILEKFVATSTDSASVKNAKMPLAEAYFQTKNYAKALEIYKTVAQQNRSPKMTMQAEWKTVLTLLATHQTTGDFPILLRKIAENKDHDFNSNAAELQSRVSSVWWRWVN